MIGTWGFLLGLDVIHWFGWLGLEGGAGLGTMKLVCSSSHNVDFNFDEDERTAPVVISTFCFIYSGEFLVVIWLFHQTP